MKAMLEIRKATVFDAEAVALLFYNTVRHVNVNDYTPSQIEAWTGPAPEPEKWRRRLATKCTFVACYQGELVGFAEFEADGHVDAVYVHHEHQGQEIASRLLERIQQEAARLGVVWLYTEASITALPFFRSRGFVVVSAQEVEYRGSIFKNYKMGKMNST